MMWHGAYLDRRWVSANNLTNFVILLEGNEGGHLCGLHSAKYIEREVNLDALL